MTVENVPAGRLDPDYVVPAAVRRAAEKAHAIHAQAYETDPNAGKTPAEIEAARVAAETVVVTPPVTPPVAPPVTPEVTPAPAASQPEPKPAADDSWKQKFEASQGRLRKAMDTINTLTDRMNGMETLLATMTQPPPVADTVIMPSPLLTAEETEQYGPDFIDVVKRAAKEMLAPELARLEAENARLSSHLGQHDTRVDVDSKTRMLDELTKLSPNWMTQNNDPDFLIWLGLPDPFSGAIRKTLLTEAFNRRDASRVAAFFNGFLANEAAPAPAIVPGDPQGRVTLESLAAPGRAKAAATTPAPAEKPIISPADITKFYADVQRGVYKGRDAERLAREKDILEAGATGRVR